MNLYVLLIVVVFLLGIVVLVTLIKTKWNRTMTEPPESETVKPLERRISGGEDD